MVEATDAVDVKQRAHLLRCRVEILATKGARLSVGDSVNFRAGALVECQLFALIPLVEPALGSRDAMRLSYLVSRIYVVLCDVMHARSGGEFISSGHFDSWEDTVDSLERAILTGED